MNKSIELTLFCLVGCGVLFFALMLRNWGFHVDENQYIGPDLGKFGAAGIFGDTHYTGKPFLFYSINYLWVTQIGTIFGHLKYISLYWLFITLHAISVSYLVFSIQRLSCSQRIILFAAILISPLYLLSATQLMMESLLIPLLLILYGTLIRIDYFGPLRKYLLILFLITVALAWGKQTTLPALAILCICFWQVLGMNGRIIFILAMLLGLAINQVATALIVLRRINFGGIGEIFNISNIQIKLNAIDDFTWVWIFYLSPLGLLLLIFTLAKNPSFLKILARKRDCWILFLSFLSIFFILFTQNADNNLFARYLYPAITLGLVALSLILIDISKYFAVLVILSYTVPLANLYAAAGTQMEWWPKIVTDELYNSGWTVLPGVPLVQWATLSSATSLEHLCVYIPLEKGERSELQKELFMKFSSNAQFFSENSKTEFDACLGHKVYLVRTYQESPNKCQPECPASQFSLTNCNTQEIRRYASNGSPGFLNNRVCLP